MHLIDFKLHLQVLLLFDKITVLVFDKTR
jgi:hypothetical protein